jgi:hypothetical protein
LRIWKYFSSSEIQDAGHKNDFFCTEMKNSVKMNKKDSKTFRIVNPDVFNQELLRNWHAEQVLRLEPNGQK